MVYMVNCTLSQCTWNVNGMPHEMYITVKERYSHSDSDQMRNQYNPFQNFFPCSLLHFVCFPDVAVVHSQQSSTHVWSGSDDAVRMAIRGSICA